MANMQLISRKQRDPESKYSYCPFCIKELEAEGKNYRELLQPLFCLKLKHWDDEVKREIFTTQYECPRCRKADIDTETFRLFYCE